MSRTTKTANESVSAELNRVIGGTHPDPHRLLGAHQSGDAVVVRARRPDAADVTVVLADGTRLPMTRLHPDGLFVATVPAAELPLDYRLELGLGNGDAVVVEDAYRFWPTLGELDLHLTGEGRNERLWDHLGAHVVEHHGVRGTSFAVWAPNAKSVRVVGDFNAWDGRIHAMRTLGSSGIWEIFLPHVGDGDRYKLEVLDAHGHIRLKADPVAFAAEVSPGTASVVVESSYEWRDSAWLEARAQCDVTAGPMSVYEVHLGSWRRNPDEGDRSLTYREMADELADYVVDMGFTHVELLPVAEHPFGGSWGYQVTSYYAPTSRFGSPDDFRHLVDTLHARGIGVIVDWVPAHFPKDEWALARFDGTALYEHADPRKGEHPDWGTLVFNFGRNEVRNFLIANALYWIEEFHIDGLRVDAVASMLYLDYSRKAGEWAPNEHGGRENLEAVAFIKEFNQVVYGRHPGVITVAEESTAWPAVSRPTYVGGLGFGLKWNMGWMHDTLSYFSHEPIHRRYHHNQLTFGLLYAFSESFMLPLSHDEVVHGKGSLIGKMPGDAWQKFANLRSLYGWMWAHPGKKLLFMGCELAQEREWAESGSLDWHLLDDPMHRGVQSLVRELNRLHREEPALHEIDFEASGFRWVDASDVNNNVLSFLRYAADGTAVACIANLSPVPRERYRIGLPTGGRWVELLNTDAPELGGSGVGNGGAIEVAATPWHGLDHSVELTLPPLGVIWLKPQV